MCRRWRRYSGWLSVRACNLSTRHNCNALPRYLHKLMIQGGRQESVWAALTAHGHAPPPSLRLLPSSIPQLSRDNLSMLLCPSSSADAWSASHVTWRVSGSHRAALTPQALEFIASFLVTHDEASRCPQQQSSISPSVFSDLLEVSNIFTQQPIFCRARAQRNLTFIFFHRPLQRRLNSPTTKSFRRLQMRAA